MTGNNRTFLDVWTVLYLRYWRNIKYISQVPRNKTSVEIYIYIEPRAKIKLWLHTFKLVSWFTVPIYFHIFFFIFFNRHTLHLFNL